MVWYDMGDMSWHGTSWHGTVWQDMTLYGTIGQHSMRYDLIQADTIRSDLTLHIYIYIYIYTGYCVHTYHMAHDVHVGRGILTRTYISHVQDVSTRETPVLKVYKAACAASAASSASFRVSLALGGPLFGSRCPCT